MHYVLLKDPRGIISIGRERHSWRGVRPTSSVAISGCAAQPASMESSQTQVVGGIGVAILNVGTQPCCTSCVMLSESRWISKEVVRLQVRV
eukprot:363391-Chlamydomonas_euryale.AAC.1